MIAINCTCIAAFEWTICCYYSIYLVAGEQGCKIVRTLNKTLAHKYLHLPLYLHRLHPAIWLVCSRPIFLCNFEAKLKWMYMTTYMIAQLIIWATSIEMLRSNAIQAHIHSYHTFISYTHIMCDIRVVVCGIYTSTARCACEAHMYTYVYVTYLYQTKWQGMCLVMLFYLIHMCIHTYIHMIYLCIYCSQCT